MDQSKPTIDLYTGYDTTVDSLKEECKMNFSDDGESNKIAG